MSSTIYTATNAWIPQSNRITRSFESGLVLLQQNFIARTGTAPSAAIALGQPFPGSTSPCIDGAYIFPAPSYQDNENGFTTCTVSAYGRWRTEPYTLREKAILDVGFGLRILDKLNPSDSQKVYFNSYENFTKILGDKIIQKFVIPKNTNIPLSAIPLKIYNISGQILPNPMTVLDIQTLFGGGFTASNTQWEFTYNKTYILNSSEFITNLLTPWPVELFYNLTSCESIDFGFWEEHTATFEVTGNKYAYAYESGEAVISDPLRLVPLLIIEKT